MGMHVIRGEVPGYSAPIAFRSAGLTYRVGDYLARTHVVEPSISPADGYGTARRYSFPDIVALRVVRELREAGLSLQRVRRAAEVLKRDWPEKGVLARARLLTDGREAFLALDAKTLVTLLERPGQTVWRTIVDVGRLARVVQKAVEREERRAA